MGNSYSVAREEQEEEEFQRLVEAVEIAQQRVVRQGDLEEAWSASPEAALYRRNPNFSQYRFEAVCCGEVSRPTTAVGLDIAATAGRSAHTSTHFVHRLAVSRSPTPTLPMHHAIAQASLLSPSHTSLSSAHPLPPSFVPPSSIAIRSEATPENDTASTTSSKRYINQPYIPDTIGSLDRGRRETSEPSCRSPSPPISLSSTSQAQRDEPSSLPQPLSTRSDPHNFDGTHRDRAHIFLPEVGLRRTHSGSGPVIVSSHYRSLTHSTSRCAGEPQVPLSEHHLQAAHLFENHYEPDAGPDPANAARGRGRRLSSNPARTTETARSSASASRTPSPSRACIGSINEGPALDLPGSTQGSVHQAPLAVQVEVVPEPGITSSPIPFEARPQAESSELYDSPQHSNIVVHNPPLVHAPPRPPSETYVPVRVITSPPPIMASVENVAASDRSVEPSSHIFYTGPIHAGRRRLPQSHSGAPMRRLQRSPAPSHTTSPQRVETRVPVEPWNVPTSRGRSSSPYRSRSLSPMRGRLNRSNSRPAPSYGVGRSQVASSRSRSPASLRDTHSASIRDFPDALPVGEGRLKPLRVATPSEGPIWSDSRQPAPSPYGDYCRERVYSPSPLHSQERAYSRSRSPCREQLYFRSWSPPPPDPHPRARSRSCSPAPARSPDQCERLLKMYEKCLEEHESRTRTWYEQTKEFSRVMQGIEKQLVLMRYSARSSVSFLPSSPTGSRDEGIAVNDRHRARDTNVPMASAVQPVSARPYPHRPYAVGLRAVRKCSDDWSPAWDVFPLKTFRGSSYAYLKIQSTWDDADLLEELGRSYDKLRTVWRKWFSLRSVRSITMVYADHTCVYPRRLGPAGVSPSKNMRLRHFLHHPEQMKGRHEFMQVLTARTDLGIEFVEGWQLTRISVAILIPVFGSLVLAVLYSVLEGAVSDAFTIAGYMTSAYSVCLVLLGLLNFVEF